MSLIHTNTLKTAQGTASVTSSFTETGGSEAVIDSTVAANATDTLIACAFTAANLQNVQIMADQNCTLKTNSAGVNAVKALTKTGTVSSGTFTITVNGQTATGVSYASTAAQVATALQALSSVGTQGVTCTGGALPATPVVCTFVGQLGLQAVTMSTNSGGLVGGGTIDSTDTTVGVAPGNTLYLVAAQPLLWWPGVNSVQSVAITGTPAGGTFILTPNGTATGTIAYNAAYSAVQSAIDSAIGAGKTLCAGGPLPGTAVSVTFIGSLAGQAIPLMRATSALTGGTLPNVTVAMSTQGRGAFVNPFTADVTAFYVTTGGTSTRFQARILTT